MSTIRSSSLSKGWENSIRLLMRKNNLAPTERGDYAAELFNFSMLFTPGYDTNEISDNYPMKKTYIYDYIKAYDLESDSLSGTALRLRQYGHNKINQIEKVTEKLKFDASSRRAVVILWDPDNDLGSEHPPCLTQLNISIKDNMLNLTAIMRSNDAWKIALADFFAISSVHDYFCTQLKKQKGFYNHFSTSYHLYESDYPSAFSVLGHL